MRSKDENREETESAEWATTETRMRERFQRNGILSLLSAPFDYFENKTGRDSPPPSIESFFDKNYRLLTIAGVFAALVAYFSQFSNEPSRPIIAGMIGGALMFGVALVIVLHRALIALAQSTALRSGVHSAAYTCIIVSLLYITVAMVAFFAQFPTAVLETIDAIATIVVVIVVWMVWLRRADITLPVPVWLGPKTGHIYHISPLIGAVLATLYSTIPVVTAGYVTVPFPSDYADSNIIKDSTLFVTIDVALLVTAASAIVILVVVTTRIIVVSTARLWKMMPFNS